MVAETAQRVLLRPPSERVGPLRVSWLYLTADDDTQIGGDLFAVLRSGSDGSRVIIGDVRGKGLAAIGEASVVLGAFREGVHRYDTLANLVEALEESVGRDLDEVTDATDDPGEHFVTALVLDIPDDDDAARMINCGHPPPLLLGTGRSPSCTAVPAPPLGLRELPSAGQRSHPFAFDPGDLLLLYTDGVIEARSPQGASTRWPSGSRLPPGPAGRPAAPHPRRPDRPHRRPARRRRRPARHHPHGPHRPSRPERRKGLSPGP